MIPTNLKDLMSSGAHFGHRTRYWHPLMERYIYGIRNGTHIINLDETFHHLKRAYSFFSEVATNQGTILFVCTKRQSRDIIANTANSCNMPYINHRWLGGLMTNFDTVRKSIAHLEALSEKIENGSLKYMTKKEGIKLTMKHDKLKASLGGIRNMEKLPDALFVIDAGHHRSTLLEARKLGIPVVCVVDTNHSPEHIDYPIPGNDDSRRSIEIYAKVMAAAIVSSNTTAEQEEKNDVGSPDVMSN